MNKISIYICIIFGLLMASCNESLDENLSDRTSFNADLYFESFGFQTARATILKTEIEYNLSIKNDVSTPLNVSLIIDESILNTYNTAYDSSYKVLAPEYYSLAGNVELTDEVTAIPLTFDVAKIVAEIGLEESSNYVVPIKLETDNEDLLLSATGREALVQISVSKPTIIFDEVFEKESIDDTVANPLLSIGAKFEFETINTADINLQPNIEKVDIYNNDNGTEYLELPANSYQFQDIIVDTENKSLAINYSIDLSLIDGDAGTYLLPVDLSSDVYAFDPDSTIYFEVTINATAPVYQGVFNLTTNQSPDNNYASKSVSFDLAEAAALLNTTEDELKNNIVFYGINKDEITLEQNYTANAPGFWFNTDGNPDFYGDNGLMYVEYMADGMFNIGQYPEAVTAGDSYTVSLALVYNGLYVRYNITLNVLNITTTYDLSIDAPVNNDYAPVALNINIDQAATDLGVTTAELQANLSLRTINASGEIVTEYTAAPPGFWLNADGNVCFWGDPGCSIYLEYDGNTNFNIGQFPDSATVGNVYDYTILLVYNEDKIVQYNVTVNII